MNPNAVNILSLNNSAIVELDEYVKLKDKAEAFDALVNIAINSYEPEEHSTSGWHPLNFAFTNEFELPTCIALDILNTAIDKLADNKDWMRSCVDNGIRWAAYSTQYGVTVDKWAPSNLERSIDLYEHPKYIAAFNKILEERRAEDVSEDTDQN
jgi:hypothetical protein